MSKIHDRTPSDKRGGRHLNGFADRQDKPDIMRRVLAMTSCKALTYKERTVAAALAARDGPKGCYPSIAQICDDVDMSRSRVFEVLKSLEAKNIVRRIRKQRVSRYVLFYETAAGSDVLETRTSEPVENPNPDVLETRTSDVLETRTSDVLETRTRKRKRIEKRKEGTYRSRVDRPAAAGAEAPPSDDPKPLAAVLAGTSLMGGARKARAAAAKADADSPASPGGASGVSNVKAMPWVAAGFVATKHGKRHWLEWREWRRSQYCTHPAHMAGKESARLYRIKMGYGPEADEIRRTA
ncbi:MAG: MarR family winged helix-turn-helix transcriptional regulator [Rhodospirillales bacterium]|nr:MarR family winged helix-turn-helix transcriptional regulator [Rhodospirillales bacterium]MCY3701499.1 MarR family winged helix-turn-helix transcriptional regulator [Rhodospirillales bacterium]